MFKVHHFKKICSLILFGICVLFARAQDTCFDYSSSLAWNVGGALNVASCTFSPPQGNLSIASNKVSYVDFRPRATRRLMQNINGVIVNQNQFRFEFDFEITAGGTDMAAILLALTQRNDHPYCNTAGGTTETDNNTIEVRLGNPLNTGTGYHISGTSKLGTVRGASSAQIGPLVPNQVYKVRLQRLAAQHVELSVWTGGFTTLVGVTCFLIDPAIDKLRRLQHASMPAAGCSRITKATVENVCYYQQPLNSCLCSPNITATYVVQDASCSGLLCDGAITLTSVSGGLAPYTYDLNGTSMPGLTFNNLCPGLNILTISDAIGCRKEFHIMVSVAPGCWQQTTWNNFFLDRGKDIEVDTDGNVYVVGEFTDYTEFECQGTVNSISSGNGNLGMYLAKFDPCGTVLWVAWSEQLNANERSNATAIELDEQNQQIYVTGEFSGSTITLHGGDMWSTQTPLNAGSGTMYVAEFNLGNGVVNWMLDYQDPNSNILFPTGICLDGGHVFAAGNSFDPLTSSWNPYVVKVAPFGVPTVVYATNLPDKDCFIEDIEKQYDGHLVVVGRYIGVIGTGLLVDPYPFVSGAGGTLSDGFAEGLSDMGTFVSQDWIRTTNANVGNAGLHDVSVDENSNIYVTGYVIGSTVNSFNEFGATVSLPGSPIGSQAVVARLNSSGNWDANSWMNYSDPSTALNEEGRGIDVENGVISVNGNISTAGTMQFLQAGTNTANGPVTSPASNGTVFVSQMNTLGLVIEMNSTEGTGVQNAEAIAGSPVFAFSTGNYVNDLVINGTTYNGAVPSNTKAFTLRNQHSVLGIPFVMVDDEWVSAPAPMTSARIWAYPNPVDNVLKVHSEADENVELVNVLGQVVEQHRLKAGIGKTIDVTELEPGTYFLKCDDARTSIQILKN